MTLPPFFRQVALERAASTNDVAKELAAEGAPEGTLVTAGEQSAGRGRGGRSWISPRGNLHASLILRPRVPVRAAGQLGFAAALAVADAASAFVPLSRLLLKWPNDVLGDGAKLAGILLESRGGPDGLLDWLVVGIGVNLAHRPAGLDFPATSLAAMGAEVAPERFLPILGKWFLARYVAWQSGGFAPLRGAWLARAHPLGAPLSMRRQGSEWRGRFAGLDEEGRLLFEGPEGRETVAAADIFPTAS